MIDGNEINRFVAPDNFWNLHEDARATLLQFESTPDGGRFVGLHSGYERLADPVVVTREIALEGERLSIVDFITGVSLRRRPPCRNEEDCDAAQLDRPYERG